MQLTPLYPIILYASDRGLEAKLVNAKLERLFTHEQISYGVLGDLPHQTLLTKIDALATANLAAFPFPQENPSELWIFEAVPMAAPTIRQAKEYVKQEQFAKALELFVAASKLQKMQGGQTDELERAICQIQKKQWKQQASLYLPMQEVQHFMEIVNAYSEIDDLDACLEALVQAADKRLPHHHWMAALVCEKQERWQEAIEAYLQLANNQAHAKACMAQVCTLIAKAQLVDRIDAVRLAFEKAVKRLSVASSLSSPTCFICYNAEESDVAEWLKQTLVPHLALAGIRPIVCLHALKIGHDVSNFQEMVEGADLVLVVCTPGLKAKCDQSVKAPMGTAQEVRLIKERCSDKNKTGTIFPIFLKGKRQQCLPTAFFGPIWGVKLTQAPFDFHYFTNAFELLAAMLQLGPQAAHVLLAEFGQAIRPLVQGQIDAEEVALWRQSQASVHQALLDAISQRVMQMIKIVNLPLPPDKFTGRKGELAHLQALCQQSQRIAITGLGGVGKTALALHYAHLHQADYTLLHFISAATPQLIIDGLLKLADDLFVPPSAKAEERLGWLKVALDRRKQDFLLIFDGIDQVEAFHEIDKYLPEKGRCLLLTSRLKGDCQLLQCQLLELQSLTLEEATNYLLLATSSQEKAQAQALAAKLGCLPLALTHAAGYIRHRGKSMQSYSDLFDRLHLKLFENEQLKLKSKEEKTILTTWNISIEAIVHKEKCLLAKDVLAFFAFLAQAAIPLNFVQVWFKNSFPMQHELDLDNALARLCDYSMIASSTPDTYSIHLLVQQVTEYQLSLENRHRTLGQALQACLSMTQELDYKAFQVRRQLDPLMPHFKAIAHQTVQHADLPHMLMLLKRIWKCDCEDGRYQDLEHMARICLELSAAQEEKTQNLNRLAQSLLHMGKPAEALRYFDDALYIINKGQEKKQTDVVAILGNMASALSALGRHPEALTYHMQALELRKELLGNKHPDVATSLNNMGYTLWCLGRHQEALKYKMQALELSKECLGHKHYAVATSLNNVGSSLSELGQHEDALKYQLQALELRKELLGDKHPDVATSLNNVGLTLSELNQHEKALTYQMQALELMKEILGNKHPHLATSLNNVGSTLLKLGQHEKAITYQIQALDLAKGFLGHKHSTVAAIFDNMGCTLVRLDQHEKAITYQIQALELRKELLGLKHPDVAKSLNNIGCTLGDLGQHREALKYHMQALELVKQLLGDKHPHVATSLNRMGCTLGHLGRHREALKYHMQALELRKEILGYKHPDIATSLNNVGLTLSELNQHEKALTYQKQALELRKEILGDKHLAVAASLSKVGYTLGRLGQHQEALTYHMQALELVKQLLGDKHPDVAISLDNVGATLESLGQHEKAITYQIQALKLRKELLGLKHPDVATSLNNVGCTLVRLGQHREALTYHMQALELRKGLLGNKHPDVAASLNNVGCTLGILGQHQQALKYKMQALELRKELLGLKHPDVATSLNNVGCTLGKLGQYQEALKYKIQAIELRKELLGDIGDKHLDVAASLSDAKSTLDELEKIS